MGKNKKSSQKLKSEKAIVSGKYVASSKTSTFSKSSKSGSSSSTSQLSIISKAKEFPIEPACFPDSFRHASIILLSDSFRQSFLNYCSDDCDEGLFDAALTKTYEIRNCYCTDLVAAFAGVHELKHPSCIFLNPFLIASFYRNQDDRRKLDTQVVFLTCKIVHEVAHLIHSKCSNVTKENKSNTPTKTIRDSYLVSRKHVVKRNVEYKDLGEMIEKDLFGGMVELNCETRTMFMELDNIIVYSSRLSTIGHFVDVNESLVNFDRGNFELVKGDLYQSTKRPNFKGIPLKSSQVRSSAPSDCDADSGSSIDEEDTVEDDDDDEECHHDSDEESGSTVYADKEDDGDDEREMGTRT